ncbi:MAG: type III pantothenate kinase [candidate division WOR-3 bacterium]
MILTILIGNTNTRLTWFQGRRIRHRLVLATRSLAARPLPLTAQPVAGVALASVVPEATAIVCRDLVQSGLRPLVVGPKTETGLGFRYNRRQLGADRVCLAVGAHRRYKKDAIVLDFGTAVTVNVITGSGEFLGGLILPGLGMMLNALAQGTAQLPAFAPAQPRSVLGHDTKGALRCGVFAILSGGLSHIIRRIEEETRRKYLVVATGGDARRFRRRIKAIRVVDQDLASRGLVELFYINRR